MNIISYKDYNLKTYASKSLTRIHTTGEQLEFYIKDAVANSFKNKNKTTVYKKVFSWIGTSNNPPDFIIKNGDAFEIKKIEGLRSSIFLNSSPPKNKLFSKDQRITFGCKTCESFKWKEKDIFYVIGCAKKGVIKYIFFVQGLCYAANQKTYSNLFNLIKQAVSNFLEHTNFKKTFTTEFANLKKIDFLGITHLRIRGMWSIQNPVVVFENFCKLEGSFQIFALMSNKKYFSHSKSLISKIQNHKNIFVNNVNINNPNNPTKSMRAKLIVYKGDNF